MKRRPAFVFLGLVTLTLASASVSVGAANPTSPTAGARTSAHPTFTWNLPSNEEADLLAIASRPDTTPSGEFFEENVVETGFLDTGAQTQWTPAKALFAGPYWWNIRTHDRNTFQTIYSGPPASFTVRPETRLIRVRVTRASYTFIPDELNIDIRWATNVREVVIEAVIMRGRRRVGRIRKVEETLLALDPDNAYLTWRRPRTVRTGTRLTLIVSVRGQGQVVSARRGLRAP